MFLNVSAHKYYILILGTFKSHTVFNIKVEKACEWFSECCLWPLVSVHLVYKNVIVQTGNMLETSNPSLCL